MSNTTTRPRPATAKQIAFIDSLCEQVAAEDAETIRKAMATIEASEHEFSTAMASAFIDQLKQFRAEKPAAAKTEQVDPPVGIHMADGRYYRVQPNKAKTRVYAFELTVTDGKFSKEYVGRSPFALLSGATLLTLAEAAEFGHSYGVCIACGLTLTNPKSVAAGIGPVCAKKF